MVPSPGSIPTDVQYNAGGGLHAWVYLHVHRELLCIRIVTTCMHLIKVAIYHVNEQMQLSTIHYCASEGCSSL